MFGVGTKNFDEGVLVVQIHNLAIGLEDVGRETAIARRSFQAILQLLAHGSHQCALLHLVRSHRVELICKRLNR